MQALPETHAEKSGQACNTYSLAGSSGSMQLVAV